MAVISLDRHFVPDPNHYLHIKNSFSEIFEWGKIKSLPQGSGVAIKEELEYRFEWGYADNRPYITPNQLNDYQPRINGQIGLSGNRSFGYLSIVCFQFGYFYAFDSFWMPELFNPRESAIMSFHFTSSYREVERQMLEAAKLAEDYWDYR